MNQSLPLVFFHIGNNDYLKYALLSAQKFNSNVYLIGDLSNKSFAERWINEDSVKSAEYNFFTSIYKHMSTNSYDFELRCFKRYYVLKKFMELKSIESCVFLDSDILVYSNLRQHFNGINSNCALSIPYNQEKFDWVASPHCSYWTYGSLCDFIHYFENIYTNEVYRLEVKYQFHKEHSLKGGICDMSLLYLWALEREVVNTNDIMNGSIIDHALAVKQIYVMNNILKIKKIKFNNGLPYFINQVTKEPIGVAALHFQGSVKALMKDYYENKLFFCFFHRYKEIVVRVLNKLEMKL